MIKEIKKTISHGIDLRKPPSQPGIISIRERSSYHLRLVGGEGDMADFHAYRCCGKRRNPSRDDSIRKSV